MNHLPHNCSVDIRCLLGLLFFSNSFVAQHSREHNYDYYNYDYRDTPEFNYTRRVIREICEKLLLNDRYVMIILITRVDTIDTVGRSLLHFFNLKIINKSRVSQQIILRVFIKVILSQ